MRIFEPKFEIVKQEPGVAGLYKVIEECGRTCYKSRDKIKEGSAMKFVNAMIKSNHGAMLEHGTVYLGISVGSPIHDDDYFRSMDAVTFYLHNKYTKVRETSRDGKAFYCITTNYRVLVENNRTDDVEKYWCEPTSFHCERVCVRFWMDRVGSQSCERHNQELCAA